MYAYINGRTNMGKRHYKSIKTTIFLVLAISLFTFSSIIVAKQCNDSIRIMNDQLLNEILPEKLRTIAYKISNDLVPLI